MHALAQPQSGHQNRNLRYIVASSPGPLLRLLLEGLVFFEWVGPRQHFCTQCHYDNFLGMPTATYSLLEKSGAAAIIGKWLPGSVSC